MGLGDTDWQFRKAIVCVVLDLLARKTRIFDFRCAVNSRRNLFDFLFE